MSKWAVGAQLLSWLADRIVYLFPGKRFQRLEDDIRVMANHHEGLAPDASQSQWNDWVHHGDVLEYRLAKLGIKMPAGREELLRLRTLSALADRKTAHKEFPLDS